MFFFNRSAFISLALFCFSSMDPVFSQEVFDTQLEAPVLKNIQQLTFPAMGFEKAGEGYFSHDGKTIIFQAVPKGQEHYQIYTMRLDEGVPRLVSTGQGACTCANFRADGKKIIFASSHEDPFLNQMNDDEVVPGYQRQGGRYSWAFTPYMNIYEANPDGTELVALTQGPDYHAECAYSSDGQKIVFASNEDGNMNLYTMDADGSHVFQVTKTDIGYNGGPFFSPNGKHIIFRADYEKADYLQVYQIDVDGTNLKQLTQNEAVNWAPYWHPKGDVIAYTTSLHGHTHYEIYLLNVLTGVDYRVTFNASFDGLPVFSSDGTKLMWTSKRGLDHTSQLFIADFNFPQELN